MRKLEGEGVEAKLHDLAVANLPNPHSYMILAIVLQLSKCLKFEAVWGVSDQMI